MSLINVIKVQVERSNGEQLGIIASPLIKVYDSELQDYVWSLNIDLQTAPSNPNSPGFEALKAVPIDDPSREVYGADIGAQVRLRRRPEDQRYVVSGLAKFSPGNISICLVCITDDDIIIDDPITFGSVIRKLNFTEIGSGSFVFGDLPFGTVGKFDLNNNLIQVITPQ